MKRFIKAWLGLSLLLAAGPALAVADGAPFAGRLPAGIAPPPVQVDNPMTEAKVELGRRLFYDADLSIDGTTACATCHEQHRAFTEGNATHGGVRGALGRRNVMGLANVGYFSPLTWADPRQTRLEDQVLVPVMGEHPVEMGMAGKPKVLIARLSGDGCYRQMFAEAFPEAGGAVTMATIAKAIAAFERTLISFDSPYDRAKRGDAAALSPAARRGEALFKGERFNCAACHAGKTFTDTAFHNIGLHDPKDLPPSPAGDHGLREVTLRFADEGKIRTPSLRNAALTGPYMHDGKTATLAQAIAEHFAAPGAPPNPWRDALLLGAAPSADEVADLTAFLDSLTDQQFVSDPRFALPKTACGKPL
jgi:cytochrome c peroxidase